MVKTASKKLKPQFWLMDPENSNVDGPYKTIQSAQDAAFFDGSETLLIVQTVAERKFPQPAFNWKLW